MTLVVRPARQGDLAAVDALTVAVYRPLLPEGDPYLRVLGQAGKRFGRAEVVVAELDGQVVGSLTVAAHGTRYSHIARPDELEFRMLAVSPAARGHGAGTALVRHVLDQAAARGLRAVVLSTQSNMVAARRIYDRLGFRDAPHRYWSPEPGLTLTVLERRLGG